MNQVCVRHELLQTRRPVTGWTLAIVAYIQNEHLSYGIALDDCLLLDDCAAEHSVPRRRAVSRRVSTLYGWDVGRYASDAVL